jgi:hypothetical protein
MLLSSVPQLHTKWAAGAARTAAEPANGDAAPRLVEVEPDHLVASGGEATA